VQRLSCVNVWRDDLGEKVLEFARLLLLGHGSQTRMTRSMPTRTPVGRRPHQSWIRRDPLLSLLLSLQQNARLVAGRKVSDLGGPRWT